MKTRIAPIVLAATLGGVTPGARADLVHQWKFNGHPTDEVGEAHGSLEGNATIIDGRLAIDGIAGSRFITAPIGEPLGAKTLVAWVSLNDLTQRGGSVLTVENNANGDIFDAIVAFERVPGQWMAGSNFFQRTVPDNGGPIETEVEPEHVLIAIAYGEDSSIAIYRNGEVYAPPETASWGVLQPFDGCAVVQIGPRHGNHRDVLNASIDEARVYDEALPIDIIEELYDQGPDPTPSREPPPPPAPELRHLWTFNEDESDLAGEAHGSLEGNATIIDGRLAVDGIAGSRFITAPIGEPLGAKTLVAWVSPNNLTQRGGSVLTVENNANGDVFDAIVAFERVPGQWMAGSNFFQRTVADNGGPIETEIDPDEMMLAIAYGEDDSIAIYRNGEVYAGADRASMGTLQWFCDGAVVQIGPRHGSHRDVFNGFINEARIYSGALDEDAIWKLYEEGPTIDEVEVRFVRGDADASGVLTIGDPIFVLNYQFAAGRTPTCLAAADANGDGALDLGDPIYSLNYQFAGGPPIPPPAACGAVPGAPCASFPPCGR